MTDKCWFVLRHTHYSPPTIPENGCGKAHGLLCIGHVTTSTRWLDIINAESGPEAYPASMPVIPGVAYDLTWSQVQGGGINVSAKADAPIAAVAGAYLGANAGIAFKSAMSRSWEFERLETFSVNITQSYIDDTMESPEVERQIAKHKKWFFVNPSLFIITGIMVGRKAKVSQTDEAQRGLNAEAMADGLEVAAVGGNFDVSRNKELSTSQRVDDVVFAIRVAKVTKGVLDKDWLWSTLSEGSTFGADDALEEKIGSIKTQLNAHGHDISQVIGLQDGVEEVFVL